MPQIRTLVVEDSRNFRRFLCSLLAQRTECELVCEAADGLEAVMQVERFKPDLILLDVGLPTLNGIEVARRIREISPHSKILFVTHDRSQEMAQGALRTGANGYVVKSDATSLPNAIQTILRGERFVSNCVSVP